jgi:hypothetical protein
MDLGTINQRLREGYYNNDENPQAGVDLVCI